MATYIPFKSYRPKEDLVHKVAALPYDVYNRDEAYEVAKNNPLSFLHIDKAEIDLDKTIPYNDEQVYTKAKDNLNKMIIDRTFIQEDKKCYYIYELTMGSTCQTGIVGLAAIDDYLENIIKKHEHTREDKELDRIKHVENCKAHTGPIFLIYKNNDILEKFIEEIKSNHEPLYDFISSDQVKHKVWKVDDLQKINIIADNFKRMNELYIADGHHRAASAVKVGIQRRKANKSSINTDHFLSVAFPHNQLKILDYNRVVKDLNGYTVKQVIDKISEKFNIEKVDNTTYAPTQKNEFGMYVDDGWYKLVLKDEYKTIDPLKSLDVNILQDLILRPILGIIEPRKDKRIEFVGGIRGLKELERRVKTDMAIAFSLFPTSINDLMYVADIGEVMPPKSTWFEPKLRSGIFINKF